MSDVDDGQQIAALVASAVALAQRAEAEPDPAKSAHLATAARDLAEVLAAIRGPQPRSRDGARSAVVQSLRQASAARARGKG